MLLADGLKLEEVFESAVNIVRNLPKEGPIKPSDELKLKLYAYFKQATHGPNDTVKPRFYQIVEAYKWDAWQKLGQMSKDEAMLAYIGELKQVMENMPRDESIESHSGRFEQILGKKFYDYWFNQLQSQQQQQEQLTASQSSAKSHLSAQTTRGGNINRGNTKANDTHSNSSSGGSSVSLLDDTAQAAENDLTGYKTPTSLDQIKATLGGQLMSDQFALAVLRLQHGLDETNCRLAQLEEQLKQSSESIRSLEANNRSPRETLVKKRLPIIASGRAGTSRLLRLLNQLQTIHWFYLSYPFVVYILMRLLFDRRRERNMNNYNRR